MAIILEHRYPTSKLNIFHGVFIRTLGKVGLGDLDAQVQRRQNGTQVRVMPCPKGQAVRNIPDINQIITGGQVWKRKGVFLVKEAKFNEDFPPLIGEIKIKQRKKQNSIAAGIIYHPGRHLPRLLAPSASLLAPSQLPEGLLLTLCLPTNPPPPSQPPTSHLLAQPGTSGPAASHPLAHPAASGPTASPPRSQAPTHIQSELPIKCNQSENSLVAGEQHQNNSFPSSEGQIQVSEEAKIYSCHSEEGEIQVSKFKNYSGPTNGSPIQVSDVSSNSTHSQWDSNSHFMHLNLDSSQTMPSQTKIDFESPMTLQQHLTPYPGEIIGSRQEWPNPQQIVK
ncbi:hypothetical protein DSO57_1009741 [Entomophthora muscae]|uniref:Uncharacterized protein n=1 Tax=Entomophthora muscae TaxID=34485 RepID=A0ACC2US42_9FUNG|nr:hypothetical protein DSO57_1009741 [Entomophthora muscae]